MQLVFSDEIFPEQSLKSIFLEGPSPRSQGVADWRHDAIKLLEEMNYDGILYIPIPREIFFGTGSADIGYDSQIPYEIRARKRSDAIVCWVDRVIDRSREDLGMPGFTTNFEMGEDFTSGRMFYGRPDTAPKCKYMDFKAREYGLPIYSHLREVLAAAVNENGAGAMRKGGEVTVPLLIWRTPQFQSWYGALRAAGHALTYAAVENVMVAPSGIFSYILRVTIWIPSERRFKENEFVFARPDISAVVAYHFDRGTNVCKIALVREFRSSVNNRSGYIVELASGSSSSPGDHPKLVALHEVQEELGLTRVVEGRLEYVGKRQLMATLSSHCAHVFMLELHDDELAQLERVSADHSPFGVVSDSERTFVQVVTMDDLYSADLDYSMIGMIAEVMSLAHSGSRGSAHLGACPTAPHSVTMPQ